MMTQMTDTHTHVLQTFFHYIDSLDLMQESYQIDRPPLCRKAFLKSFFLKTYFRLDSLRKLVRFLKEFRYF
jgi:hypothetical protein